MDDPTTEIKRALRLLFRPGEVVELRCFQRASSIVNGYYKNWDQLAADAVTINTQLEPKLSVYACLNPCRPDLYARRPDTFGRAGSGEAVSDSEVLLRRWLLVDCDPIRPKGVSATAEQKAVANELAKIAYSYITEQLQLPRPIVGDSGNGFHLLLPLADLENSAEAKLACQRLLKQIAEQCTHPAAKIDASMFNASRICKLPGTIARKGASTDEQPHRLAHLLSIPDPLERISLDRLQSTVGQLPGQSDALQLAPQTIENNGQGWDIPALLEQRAIDYTTTSDVSDSGDRWEKYSFACPFSSEHDDGFVLLRWDNGAIAAKCHHDSCQGKAWSDLKRIWKLPNAGGISAADIILPATQQPAVQPQELLIVRSLDVQPEPIGWLWQDRFVIGGINLCCGRGGIGKTYFLCDLVARITNDALPAPNGQPLLHGRVLYSTGEDHLGKIIEPRMQAHGVDRSRLEYIKGLPAGPYVQLLDVLTHADNLRDAIEQRPDTIALVLDPISSFQGQADSNKVAQVRRFTAVLTQLSEEFGIAVLGIHHFNKGKRDQAGDSISGSHAYRDAARSIWLFALDGNDPERRLAVCDKHNWAATRPPGMAYRIEQGRIAYESEPIDLTPDELMQQATQQPVDVACSWLLAQLSTGPQPAINLQIAAATEGIADRTLNRAKKRLGVVSRKQGNAWHWSLPNGEQQPED